MKYSKLSKKRIASAIDNGALTMTAIAEILGVSRQAVSSYMNKYNSLLEYYENSKIVDDEKKKIKLEDIAYKLATNGEVYMLKFLLERRFGYKNNLDLTSQGDKITNNITVEIIHKKNES